MKNFNLLKLNIVLVLVILCFYSSSIFAQPSTALDDTKFVIVEAEGSGPTKIEALSAAWSEAVKLGVGMFLASKTEVIDNNIKEQIVSYSRGRVNSYEEISSEKKDNIWSVKIRAKIEKDILEETAKIINEKTISISSSGLGNAARQAKVNLETEEDKIKASVELFQLFLDKYDFNSLYEIGEVKSSINDEKLIVEYSINFNNNMYKEIINSLMQLLDQISISKAELNYSNNFIKNNKILLQEKKLKHSNSKENFPYSYETFKYHTFRIPINFGKYIEYKLSEQISNIIYQLTVQKYGKYFFDSHRLVLTTAVELYSNKELFDLVNNKINFYPFFQDGSGNGKYCLYPYISGDGNAYLEWPIVTEFDVKNFDRQGENMIGNIEIKVSITDISEL
jgi:hypothetical protein